MISPARHGVGFLARTMLALLAAAALLTMPVRAPAAQQKAEEEFSSRARQAILMDADSGAVLFQSNADELAPPASMSKLMTLAVVFKQLKSGQVKLEDEFIMSEHAWRAGGAPSGTSAMFVPVNTKASLKELLQGIIVQSGNDACIAVAEALAGSEEAFAAAMTEEARRIGLTKSTFRNATGLYHPEHLMTVRELAILARYIIKTYPEYYPIFSQKEFIYRKHRFINRNPLLFMNLNVDGLKTGHLKESGYGLVASAVQDGRRLILVVNGLESAEERKSEARRLLEWGYKGFAAFKLFEADEVVGYARVWGGDRMYVPLTGDGELAVVLPRYPSNQRLKGEIVYKGPLKAPIHKGDKVAVLRVTSSSSASSELPLYAAEEVPSGSFVRKGLDSLFQLAFGRIAL